MPHPRTYMRPGARLVHCAPRSGRPLDDYGESHAIAEAEDDDDDERRQHRAAHLLLKRHYDIPRAS